jgi:hypothetical protein
MSEACIPSQTVYCHCTYQFSDWGACQPSGVQFRTVIGTPQPPGCIGVPQLWQSCVYTPPISAMACEARITYPQGDPSNATMQPMGPWCDAAGVELAVAVMLAKLLGSPH